MDQVFVHMRALTEAGGEGLVGLMATVAIVGWRVYRLPMLQDKLPARMRWDTLSPLKQWAVTLTGSALGGVLTAMSTGKSGWELVGAALRAIRDVLLS